MANADVLIVGGGIIGAACANELSQRGLNVTVIDRGEIGYGCSYGNAGWITPSHALPLPVPGVLRESVRWLFDPESPLYIRPRLSWTLFTWLASFARHTTRRHLEHASRALTDLALPSLAFYRQFAAGRESQLGFRQNGLLMAHDTQQGMNQAVEDMALIEKLGVPGRVLNANQAHEMEPALTCPLVGAVLYTEEAQAEPLRMVQALMEAAAGRGANILPRTEVMGFETRHGQVEATVTTRGRLRAGQVVLAAGSWSPRLGKWIGVKIPIQAGKGYSIAIEPFEPLPKFQAYLGSSRIGMTPRDGSVKFAGTMELAGMDDSITRRRVMAILRGAQSFYNVPSEPKIIEIWRGLRPCTPDGLPAIGRPKRRTRKQRWENLIVAAGHAMLGLTLAPATARVVADLVEGKTPEIDAAPFDPARF